MMIILLLRRKKKYMRKEAIYKELGRKIKLARNNAKLSQELLAKRIGLSRSSVTNIEKGRQHIPFHMLFQIADALGLNPIALIPPKNENKHPLTNKLDKKLSRDGTLEEEGKFWVQSVIKSKIKEEDNDD